MERHTALRRREFPTGGWELAPTALSWDRWSLEPIGWWTMALIHTVDRTVRRRALLSSVLLVLLGVGTGLLFGLTVVHLLGWLGLPVDTDIGGLLRRVFLP